MIFIGSFVMNIVGLTKCDAGTVRNNLAAARLTNAAQKHGFVIHLEVVESEPFQAMLGFEDLALADLAIVASDSLAYEDVRFEALPTLTVPIQEAISRPMQVIERAKQVVDKGDERAYVDHRLLTTGIAQTTAAYLGRLYGCQTIPQALQIGTVHRHVHGVLEECGSILAHRYRGNENRYTRNIESVLIRLARPWQAATIVQLTRDPIRMLARHERFLRSLLAAHEYGLPHQNLAKALAALLHFSDQENAQWTLLCKDIGNLGVFAVLKQCSGNAFPDQLLREVENHWDSIRERKRVKLFSQPFEDDSSYEFAAD